MRMHVHVHVHVQVDVHVHVHAQEPSRLHVHVHVHVHVHAQEPSRLNDPSTQPYLLPPAVQMHLLMHVPGPEANPQMVAYAVAEAPFVVKVKVSPGCGVGVRRDE